MEILYINFTWVSRNLSFLLLRLLFGCNQVSQYKLYITQLTLCHKAFLYWLECWENKNGLINEAIFYLARQKMTGKR